MHTARDHSSTTRYREWTALGGDLVFRFEIDPGPAFEDPTRVTVLSLGPQVRQGVASPQHFEVVSSQRTLIDLIFETGVEVRGHLIQKNNVLIDGLNSIAIFVDLVFGHGKAEFLHFEGVMVYCPCASPPHPPTPTPSPAPPIGPGDYHPGDPISPRPILRPPSERLFPYVYVRQWSARELSEHAIEFIEYAGTSPPDPFISDLAAAQTMAARTRLALGFIEGAAPYQGQFVPFPRRIESPIARFASLGERLHLLDTGPQEWLDAAQTALGEMLSEYDEPAGYYSSPAYELLIDRIWQSYFALVTLNEYAARLRDELARILYVAHIAGATLRVFEGKPVRLDLDDGAIRRLRAAAIVLPEFIFERRAKVIADAGSWGLPYAIGDLQLVRQELKGYAPGEIARIESVMPGERREVRSRRLRQNIENEETQSDELRSSLLESDDGRDSLQREAQRLIGERTTTKDYKNYQTTYGPPTVATINGKAITTIDHGAPARSDDETTFARKILSHSLERVSRSVRVARKTTALFEAEHLVSSIIDNTNSRSSIRAIYRWVNKVYEAQVVNYGRRLLMEFSIANPARRLIRQAADLSGSMLAPPVSPQEAFGLNSFEDITRENYAEICATYHVTQVSPPPPRSVLIGTTLRGDDEQALSVPAGFRAVEAKAECTSDPASPPQSPPPVLIGSVLLTDGTSQKLPPYSDGMSIPVSSAAPSPGLPPLPEGSPPSDGASKAILTNVEVVCEPTPERMNEWRISVYRSVVEGYRALADRYFEVLDQPGAHKGAALNPQYELETEIAELKERCVDLMIECLVADLADGATSPPTNFPTYSYAYHQFLNAALEWGEMSYFFTEETSSGSLPDPVRSGKSAQQGSDFARFLQASEARILLPVRPEYLRAFLYFWSSGLIWQGPDWLVPLFKDETALTIDAQWHGGDRSEVEIDAWPIVIPTAMQILDDGTGELSPLPSFRTKGGDNAG